MNRRELLKLFGLTAGTAIIPLHREWGSREVYRLRRVSVAKAAYYRVVELRAEGMLDHPQAGQVALLSGDNVLFQASLNAYGGLLFWVPPIGAEPYVLKELLRIKTFNGVRVIVHAMEDDFHRIITVEAN